MFWIGLAVGAAICMIVIIIGLSAIAYGVGKERAHSAKLADKYWEESLLIQNRNADTFERIEGLLREPKK